MAHNYTIVHLLLAWYIGALSMLITQQLTIWLAKKNWHKKYHEIDTTKAITNTK
jgi:hypothetical protein